MATVNIYLDGRRPKADGTCQLKVSITHQGKTRYISLNLAINPSNWYQDLNMVSPGERQHRQINGYIADALARAEDAVRGLTCTGKPDLGVADFQAAVAEALGREVRAKVDKTLLVPCFERYIALKEKKKTKESLEHTLSKLREFAPSLDRLRFDDIKRSWLMEFDVFLSKTSSPNTRGIHFRNLRTVFNFAIDDEITTNYPFRKFRIPKEATRKRSLDVEDLRELFAMEVEDWQRPYLDYFKLTFCLIGINAVDLLQMPPDGLVKGRLEFNRSKTGRPYSIKVEPEAMEIIERMRGECYLIDPLDRCGNYEFYLKRVNKVLKQLGTVERKGRGGKKIISAAFPKLSTYWARHTWASIAADLDVPDATISLALGHAGENATTEIYIRRNIHKVDDANRRVLDWVFNGIR